MTHQTDFEIKIGIDIFNVNYDKLLILIQTYVNGKIALRNKNNNITEECATTILGIIFNKNIEYLKLIGFWPSKVISKFLNLNNTLRTLIIDRNKTSENILKYISDALKKNTTLLKLKFKSSNINYIESSDIADSIKDNRKYSTLGRWSYKKLLEYIEDSRKDNTTLVILKIKSPNIYHIGFSDITDALEMHRRPFICRDSTDNITEYITDTLNENTVLFVLKLKSSYIIDSLNENVTLTKLHFKYCDIGDIVISEIGDSLKVNSSLKSLCIMLSNECDDDNFEYECYDDNFVYDRHYISNYNDDYHSSVNHIANVLETNTSLLKLKINIGIMFLPKMLEVNKSITTLDISSVKNNYTNTIIPKCISNILKINCNVTKLKISPNFLNMDDYLLILGALEENTSLYSLIFKNKRYDPYVDDTVINKYSNFLRTCNSSALSVLKLGSKSQRTKLIDSIYKRSSIGKRGKFAYS